MANLCSCHQHNCEHKELEIAILEKRDLDRARREQLWTLRSMNAGLFTVDELMRLMALNEDALTEDDDNFLDSLLAEASAPVEYPTCKSCGVVLPCHIHG